MYRVIYKLIHGDFLLSKEMSLEAACDLEMYICSKDMILNEIKQSPL